MVVINLKGTKETDSKPYKHSVPIARFRGSVYFEEGGIIVIQLSSKELTKKFQKVFKQTGEINGLQ